MRSFLIAALIGFIVGGGPFHLFTLISDWVSNRQCDVRAGHRKHWWSKRITKPLTIKELAAYYEATIVGMRKEYQEMPMPQLLRPSPGKGE